MGAYSKSHERGFKKTRKTGYPKKRPIDMTRKFVYIVSAGSSGIGKNMSRLHKNGT